MAVWPAESMTLPILEDLVLLLVREWPEPPYSEQRHQTFEGHLLYLKSVLAQLSIWSSYVFSKIKHAMCFFSRVVGLLQLQDQPAVGSVCLCHHWKCSQHGLSFCRIGIGPCEDIKDERKESRKDVKKRARVESKQMHVTLHGCDPTPPLFNSLGLVSTEACPHLILRLMGARSPGGSHIWASPDKVLGSVARHSRDWLHLFSADAG